METIEELDSWLAERHLNGHWRGMGRNPDEVDPSSRRDQRQLRDEGRAPLFVPRVEHDASEQER